MPADDRRPEPPGFPPLPPARIVELPGRGSLLVREVDGPAEAGGPPLLLLHGLTANADLNWFATYGPLGGTHRVIAPDQRGHGEGIPVGPFRLTDLADDAAALLRQLGAAPAIVVGYSMGGAVAQLLWRRHPDVVAGLVLCATAADYREPTAKGKLVEQPLRFGLGIAGRVLPRGLRARLVELAQRSTLARVQPTEGKEDPLQQWGAQQLLRSDPLQVAAASAAIRRFHSEAWAAQIDVPTALVINTRDTVVLTDRQRELGRLVAAKTWEIDATHGAFIEDTGAFVPALVEAVAAVAGEVTPA